MSEIFAATAVRQKLCDGLRSLGMPVDQHTVDAYCAYLQLLTEWNKAYNLTAIREPEQMVVQHVLDSLAVLPYLHGKLCLDVGSGAGLPGLILALADPDSHWVLLDSNRKKIRFLNQVVLELKLENVEVVCSRAEAFKADSHFSTIISRALGSLSQFYDYSHHLLLPDGRLFAMKGPNVSAEVAELDQKLLKVQVHLLDIPNISGQRTLVELSVFPSGN